eukprot:m.316293 g.316293  ORF g.316293 m.316293 type:complete len:78 (-) comp16422_c2_seq2:902-1135(-)
MGPSNTATLREGVLLISVGQNAIFETESSRNPSADRQRWALTISSILHLWLSMPMWLAEFVKKCVPISMVEASSRYK